MIAAAFDPSFGTAGPAAGTHKDPAILERYGSRRRATTELKLRSLCHALLVGDHLNPLCFNSSLISLSGISLKTI